MKPVKPATNQANPVRRDGRSTPSGTAHPPTSFRTRLRRLALWAGVVLVGLYLLGATAGYLWLRYSRKVEGVGFLQVAFLQGTAIKRAMAVQQFAQAKHEWEAKNFQAAYVYYTSAVRRDPDNLEGRLDAARFLAVVGARNQEINLLEEGFARSPDDPVLNATLFTLLLTSERYQRLLELLQSNQARVLAGPNAAILQTAELQATLQAKGAPAAKALLAQRPELRKVTTALPVVARVLWESGDREPAIQLLFSFIQAQPQQYPAYALLAGWQREAGQGDEAIRTAMKACERFPQDPAPRALLCDVGADKILGTPDWWKQLVIYLRDFGARRDAVLLLAELAGRHGWLDVARTLYLLGADRGHDLGLLGLLYSDALLHQSRVAEARAMLLEIEQQSDERIPQFLQQLRRRQVAVAAAAGDREGIREAARRLAALVRSDPDSFEQHRRYYQSLGLAEAVAEFTENKNRPAPKLPAKSK